MTAVPLDSVESRTYKVPTDQPEADGTIAWSETTVVVALVRAGPQTGLGWTYGAAATRPLIEDQLAGAVTGTDAFDVVAATEKMIRACRNLGRPGLASGAISAVDIALWDLKAKLLGIPLATLLGTWRREVPFYGSGGFTTYDDPTTVRQLEGWVEGLGARSCKIKIGEDWGGRPDRDLARVALARRTIGQDVQLMVDANGAYSRKQAVRLGRQMAAESGVVWFEEPVSSDDLAGLREVRDQVEVDVAAGEYGYDPNYFAAMLSAGAVDCLQADASRCGGYTGWLAAAAVARSHCMEISAHCGPNLHTPVAAAAVNLRHVEYFHDHARLDPLLFGGLPEVGGGTLAVQTDRPGHGMFLKEDDAAAYRQA